MENLWDIQSMYELQFFNCPSCIFKNHSKQEIVNHAYNNHPESIECLKNIKDESLMDVVFPWNENIVVFELKNISKIKSQIKEEPKIKDEPDPIEDMVINQTEYPWNIQSIYELQFFNCPSCIFKSRSKQEIVNHAFEIHPESIKSLKNIKGESLKDIVLPWNENIPFESQNVSKIKTEIKEELQIKEEIDEDFDSIPFESDDLDLDFLDANYKICKYDLSEDPKTTKTKNNNNHFLDKEKFSKKLPIIECQSVEIQENISQQTPEEKENAIKIVKCTFCNISYQSGSNKKIQTLGYLKQHILTDHKIQVYNKSVYEQLREVDDHKCNSSDSLCHNSNNLKQHISQCHSGQICKNCQNCDQAFMKSCILNQHINKSYANFVENDTKTNNSEELSKVSNQQNNCEMESQKNFKICYMCNKKFPLNYFKVHITTVHGGVFQCHLCYKFMKSYGALKTHVTIKHGDMNKNFKCDHCKKCFSQAGSLKIHIKTVHEGIKDHKCDHCEKRFSQAWNLKKHIKAVHEGIKDKKCDHCGKSFTTTQSLKKHVKTVHEGIKGHRCDQCGLDFSKSGSLNKHVKTMHEGIKDRKCNSCGKSFSHGWNLKKHIKEVHKGIKDFKCDHCKKCFSQPGSLKIHIKAVHEGIKDHECDHCEKRFSIAGHLKRHVKAVHEGPQA